VLKRAEIVFHPPFALADRLLNLLICHQKANTPQAVCSAAVD
jgi:hypothetical protein